MTNWFQTDECLNFYKQLDFIEPFDFSIYRDGQVKGRIVGYIQKDGGKLKQFLSRRAIINGGPMLADDITEDELTDLLAKCSYSLIKKAIFVEFRNFENYRIYTETFSKCGFTYEPHYDFHIDTTTLEIVDSNIGKSRKRDIRTSLRDGAEIIEAENLEQVKDFYSILMNLYEAKVKTPLFPFSFFEKLFRSASGKFLLVKYQGKIIGGTACVLGLGIVYEWFACGMDGVYKNIHPSTVATYAGIKYAAEHGFKRFDMMGAGAPGDGGYGVRDFKAKFGGELVEYGRFKCILNKPLYFIGKLGVKILKKL